MALMLCLSRLEQGYRSSNQIYPPRCLNPSRVKSLSLGRPIRLQWADKLRRFLRVWRGFQHQLKKSPTIWTAMEWSRRIWKVSFRRLLKATIPKVQMNLGTTLLKNESKASSMSLRRCIARSKEFGTRFLNFKIDLKPTGKSHWRWSRLG